MGCRTSSRIEEAVEEKKGKRKEEDEGVPEEEIVFDEGKMWCSGTPFCVEKEVTRILWVSVVHENTK